MNSISCNMGATIDLAYKGIKNAMNNQAKVAEQVMGLQSGSNGTDIAKQMVQSIENEHTVSANTSVVKSVDKMIGNVIDLVA